MVSILCCSHQIRQYHTVSNWWSWHLALSQENQELVNLNLGIIRWSWWSGCILLGLILHPRIVKWESNSKIWFLCVKSPYGKHSQEEMNEFQFAEFSEMDLGFLCSPEDLAMSIILLKFISCSFLTLSVPLLPQDSTFISSNLYHINLYPMFLSVLFRDLYPFQPTL